MGQGRGRVQRGDHQGGCEEERWRDGQGDEVHVRERVWRGGCGGSNGEAMIQEENMKVEAQEVPGVMLQAEGEGRWLSSSSPSHEHTPMGSSPPSVLEPPFAFSS